MELEFNLSTNCRKFLDHWKGLCRPGSVPSLADFLDNPVPSLQPWLNINDVDDTASYRIRLIGTGVADCFGRDFTGTNALDLIRGETLDALTLFHTNICNIPCGLHQEFLASSAKGRELAMFSFGLPLLRKEGRRSVVWFLEVFAEPSVREEGVSLTKIGKPRWIDLGFGVPQLMLSDSWRVVTPTHPSKSP
jgi:hypothetical protein